MGLSYLELDRESQTWLGEALPVMAASPVVNSSCFFVDFRLNTRERERSTERQGVSQIKKTDKQRDERMDGQKDG